MREYGGVMARVPLRQNQVAKKPFHTARNWREVLTNMKDSHFVLLP
jgi:hypothetical protein